MKWFDLFGLWHFSSKHSEMLDAKLAKLNLSKLEIPIRSADKSWGYAYTFQGDVGEPSVTGLFILFKPITTIKQS